MLSNLEIIRFKKILLTAKLDLAFGSVQFWQSSGFFFSSNYFQIGKHVVLLRILIITVIIMKIKIMTMSIGSV